MSSFKDDAPTKDDLKEIINKVVGDAIVKLVGEGEHLIVLNFPTVTEHGWPLEIDYDTFQTLQKPDNVHLLVLQGAEKIIHVPLGEKK